MTPLKALEGLEVTGRVQQMDLPVIYVRLRSLTCCSWEDGKAKRVPPSITSDSLTPPVSSLMARWKASRSPNDFEIRLTVS